jgi:enamine deaminase RidA (YjgF/YER057c/UK114 family)
MSIKPQFFTDPRGRDYSEVVVAGDLAFVSGQIALDEHDNVVGEGDVEAQARQAFANLESALARCGSALDRVIKLTVHFQDIEAGYPAFVKVRRGVLSAPFPASTGVQSRLMMPELLIEIEAVALVP